MSIRGSAAWQLCAVGSIVVACLLCPQALAREAEADETVTGFPERTDAGDWYGTWYYVSRQYKAALWIREGKDHPELKLQIFAPNKAESVITDWVPQARYSHQGRQGNFLITYDGRDDNTISGGWFWELRGQDYLRLETAKITMYRAHDGRALVLRFGGWERYIRLADDETRNRTETAWTFRKASRREVLWHELPF